VWFYEETKKQKQKRRTNENKTHLRPHRSFGWMRTETKVMNYLMGCAMWMWAIVGILLIVA
jgi:hypothetical protein